MLNGLKVNKAPRTPSTPLSPPPYPYPHTPTHTHTCTHALPDPQAYLLSKGAWSAAGLLQIVALPRVPQPVLPELVIATAKGIGT
jgi:hypothetical protein